MIGRKHMIRKLIGYKAIFRNGVTFSFRNNVLRVRAQKDKKHKMDRQLCFRLLSMLNQRKKKLQKNEVYLVNYISFSTIVLVGHMTIRWKRTQDSLNMLHRMTWSSSILKWRAAGTSQTKKALQTKDINLNLWWRWWISWLRPSKIILNNKLFLLISVIWYISLILVICFGAGTGIILKGRGDNYEKSLALI